MKCITVLFSFSSTDLKTLVRMQWSVTELASHIVPIPNYVLHHDTSNIFHLVFYGSRSFQIMLGYS